MSQQMKANPGTTKDRSSGSRRIKKHLFLWMLSHPLFVLVYVLFCRNAYELCMYGGVQRRGSVLLGCCLFFSLYLVCYLYRCSRLHARGEAEPDWQQVWFYGFHKDRVYFVDKGRGYLEKQLSKEERDFVKLKSAQIPRYRFHFWKAPVIVFLVVVTIVTLCGIYRSSQHYNGKLAWVIRELQTSTYVVLEQDNLYESGVRGILEDVGQKEALPAHLTIDGAFNLHFAPDGTIRSLHMALRGYDSNYEFVDTYLISYPSRGNRIRVQRANYAEGQAYDEAQSIEALLVGERWIPYTEVLGDWDEEEYALYYLGSRTWSPLDENIYILEPGGRISPVDWSGMNEITGYSISVFCPDDSELIPKRYMVSP